MNKRIGFFLSAEFHHAMIDPVYELLKDRFECLMSDDRDEMIAFKPAVIVLADHYEAFFYEHLPNVIIVWTRHGFANKNYLASSLSWCDYACLSSDWIKEEYISLRGKTRRGFWVTGFTPMDEVFEHISSTQKLPIESKTLLWAPTFSPDLNSVDPLGWFVPKLIEQYPNLNIVIKPHPKIFEQGRNYWINTWRAWEETYKNVTLLPQEQHNVYALMPNVDILLTDVSSVMFYFLALDKPIIVVNNPERFHDKRFQLAGHEWKWRDMASEVETQEQFFEAVSENLAYPEKKASIRETYRKRVFGKSFDGLAAHRIAENIKQLPVFNS